MRKIHNLSPIMPVCRLMIQMILMLNNNHYSMYLLALSLLASILNSWPSTVSVFLHMFCELVLHCEIFFHCNPHWNRFFLLPCYVRNHCFFGTDTILWTLYAVLIVIWWDANKNGQLHDNNVDCVWFVLWLFWLHCFKIGSSISKNRR